MSFRKKAKLEIAEKMLRKGMSVEEVKEITGLKDKEIEKIKKDKKL